MRLAPLVALMVMAAYGVWVYAQELPVDVPGSVCNVGSDRGDWSGSLFPNLGPQDEVSPQNNQCLDPGNGGSAVCGGYTCFTKCEIVTVNDCVWRWVCAAFGAICQYWTVDPRGRALCAATTFGCIAYDWQQVCTPRQEERCQMYCVR